MTTNTPIINILNTSRACINKKLLTNAPIDTATTAETVIFKNGKISRLIFEIQSVKNKMFRQTTVILQSNVLKGAPKILNVVIETSIYSVIALTKAPATIEIIVLLAFPHACNIAFVIVIRQAEITASERNESNGAEVFNTELFPGNINDIISLLNTDNPNDAGIATNSVNCNEDKTTFCIVSLSSFAPTNEAIIGTADIAIGDINEGIRLNKGTAILP